LGIKITALVSWFRAQNQAGYSLSVAPQNRWEDNSVQGTCRGLVVCFTWKQVMLGFLSLASRLTEAQRWVVHVASSRRLRRVEAEDGWVDAMGYIGLFYPNFAIFFVLCHKGSLVIIFI
jgi:hypothetical protein